jgi:hypothetical protein
LPIATSLKMEGGNDQQCNSCDVNGNICVIRIRPCTGARIRTLAERDGSDQAIFGLYRLRQERQGFHGAIHELCERGIRFAGGA